MILTCIIYGMQFGNLRYQGYIKLYARLRGKIFLNPLIYPHWKIIRLRANIGPIEAQYQTCVERRLDRISFSFNAYQIPSHVSLLIQR